MKHFRFAIVSLLVAQLMSKDEKGDIVLSTEIPIPEGAIPETMDVVGKQLGIAYNPGVGSKVHQYAKAWPCNKNVPNEAEIADIFTQIRDDKCAYMDKRLLKAVAAPVAEATDADTIIVDTDATGEMPESISKEPGKKKNKNKGK